MLCKALVGKMQEDIDETGTEAGQQRRCRREVGRGGKDNACVERMMQCEGTENEESAGGGWAVTCIGMRRNMHHKR